MSYRSSFSQAPAGGRGSPYAPRLGTQDRSFSDLFEYVNPSEEGAHRQDDHSAIPIEDDDAPDLIHVKYMGQVFRLSFPAYSISESGVTVQELRRRVAEGLGHDPRRVRLVYKDQELKYDLYPIKRYGCKQNSEIAVVVTEQFNDYGGPDHHASSGDDSGSASSRRPPNDRARPRGLSSVRHRRNEEMTPNTTADGYLAPNGHARRESRRNVLSPSRSREPSPAPRDRTPLVESPKQSAPPSPKQPAADPNSPLGKVQHLQHLYYDLWVPESRRFLHSPPSDLALREREYRRISESIMKNVIEAADAIELQGDQEARAERKKVLSEAQEMLKMLDALPRSK